MYWVLTTILIAQGLPTVPTWVPPEERRQALAASVVQVEVSLPKHKHITTYGDDGPRGAAVWILPPVEGATPVLLTSEFLVRGAEKIILRHGRETFPTEVVRAEVATGLATLTAPKELTDRLSAATFTPSELIPHRGYTIADRQLVMIAVVGRGEEQLEWYWKTTPSLPGGHAFFDERGHVVGIFGVQSTDHPEHGFAILGAPIKGFLAPAKPEPEKPDRFELRSVGGRAIEDR